ncbi:PAS domain S-box protein [Methylobacterium sp. JK268]
MTLLPFPILVGDPAGRCLFGNPAFQRLAARTATELLGDGWQDAIDPEDRARAAAAWREAIATTEPLEIEVRLRSATSPPRWFLIRGAPIRTDGRVDGWISAFIDVDDRRLRVQIAQAEQAWTRTALDDSEARYRSIFENAAVGIACIDVARGRWTAVNDTLCRLLGFPREDLLAQPIERFAHPADIDLFRRLAAGEGPRSSADIRLIHEAGEIVWTRLTASAVTATDGSAPSTILVVEDIRERKAREAEVAAEAADQSLLLAISDGIRTLDDERAMIALACGLLGAHLGVHRLTYATLGEDDSLAAWHAWCADPASRAAMGLDTRVRARLDALRRGQVIALADDPPRAAAGAGRGAGEAGPGSTTLCIPLLQDGDLRAVLIAEASLDRPWSASRTALLVDVCERVWVAAARARAEAALIASEARLQRIVRSGIVGVGFGDVDGTVTEVNDAFLAIIGRSRAEFDARRINWRTLTAPGDAPRDEVAVAELLRDGICRPYEKEYVLPARRVPVQVVMAALDPERDRAKHVALIVDLSELKAAQAALAESHARLEQRVVERTAELSLANERLRVEVRRRAAVQAALLQSQKLEALGHLTSSVAHDFNNILAAVLGGFGLIEKHAADPRLLGVAREGAKAAERGASLIRQLLAFARQQTVQTTVVDLTTLLAELRPHLLHVVGEAVTVVMEIPELLPPVRTDPTQLHAALLNLAANARDAMPGGGTLRVRASTVAGDAAERPAELGDRPAIAIQVSDTGQGMAPAVLQRVIEPFYTTKGPGRGTGLGLAMVQGLMLQSGGALRIASAEGRGTQVSLFLPAAEAVREDEPAVEREETREHAGGRALIVEDDAGVRAVVVAQLEDWGYAVLHAETPADAVARVDDCRDLAFAVADYTLAGPDGASIAAALRRRRPDLPILFITGRGDLAATEGEWLLRKPFSADALSRCLLDMLEHAASRAQTEATLDRLARRIRSEPLRVALAAWRQARGERRLPHPDAIGLGPEALAWTARIEVDQGRLPVAFRIAAIGDALAGRAQAPLTGQSVTLLGSDDEDRQEGAYRRCVRLGKPTYEYGRYGFGDGDRTTFERLLLPCATDGRTIDTLVSTAHLTDSAASSA